MDENKTDPNNALVGSIEDLLRQARAGEISAFGYVVTRPDGSPALGTALGDVSPAGIVSAIGATSLLDQEFKSRLAELQMYLAELPSE